MTSPLADSDTGPLLICGMHRSGTSLVSECLYAAGVHLGDDLLGPSSHNPDGYYENRAVVEFHADRLSAEGRQWHDLPPNSDESTTASWSDETRRSARRLLQDLQEGGDDLWGWKDPRTCLFLEEWGELLERPRLLCVYRDPKVVVESLLRRGDLTAHGRNQREQIRHGLSLWTAYNNRLLAFEGTNQARVQFVRFPNDVEQAGVLGQAVEQLTGDRTLARRTERAARYYYRPELLSDPRPQIRWQAWWHRDAANTFRHLNERRSRQSVGERPVNVSTSSPPPPRTAVAVRSRHAYSETFIQDHVRALKPSVTVIHNGAEPVFVGTSDTIFPRWIEQPARAAAHALRRTPEQVLSFLGRQTSTDRFARWMADTLRRHDIDVVLAEFGPMAARMTEPCRQADVPLIAHFHGYDVSHREVLQRERESYQTLFRQAARIIGVSEAMITRLETLGAPAEKLELLPYSVDTELFRPPDNPPNRPQFLAVGRFVEKKAPHLTLLAFRSVRERLPDAQLTMVGNGPLLGACKTLARTLGVADATTFTGVVGHAAVARLMRTHFAFVQHSVQAENGDSEGLPNTILEAAASGLPIVTTRHAGIPDVLDDGTSGVLIEEGEVSAMADAMVRVARETGFGRSLGQRARETIEAEYDYDTYRTSLRRLIREGAR